MGIKIDKKFNKDCEKFLISIGATKGDFSMGYDWSVNTTLGELLITIPDAESPGRSKVYTIYTRFRDAARASAALGVFTCNKFSGKWNFHEYSPDECLNLFQSNVNRLLVQ